jgi:hypothetical protein
VKPPEPYAAWVELPEGEAPPTEGDFVDILHFRQIAPRIRRGEIVGRFVPPPEPPKEGT